MFGFGKKNEEENLAIDEWDIDHEIKALEYNLKTLPHGDPKRAMIIEEIRKLSEIKKIRSEESKNNNESASRWTQVVGGIATTVGTLFITSRIGNKAYKVDESDEIVKNKNLLGFFGKFFHPKL